MPSYVEICRVNFLYICIQYCALAEGPAFGICHVIFEYAKCTVHICKTYCAVTKGHAFGMCKVILEYAE